MNDRNSGEWLDITERAPESVWRRLGAVEVGVEKLAEQASVLGFQGVEKPQFDPYAEMTAPSVEVPDLDSKNIRKVVNSAAPASDQFAERYGSNGVTGGQGSVQEAL